MRVALVSSAGQCGIAEHSYQLEAAVRHADVSIEIRMNADWLDPAGFGTENPITQFDVVHLNYHRGLHSRWTPDVIRCFPDLPFVITFHDTYETQPDRLPWELLACPNVTAMVVHEPCDLWLPDRAIFEYEKADGKHKVHYWRQPVPERTGTRAPRPRVFEGGWRPALGTLGFDFPWKNYNLLAEVTALCGWNLRIVGQVPEDRQLTLQALNPHTHFDGFVSSIAAVAALESCDATAFLYTCANSGTSGAIRLGIAAGRPLVATDDCRQFRDLTTLGETGILWTEPTAEGLLHALCYGVPRNAGPSGYALPLLALGHRERWPLAGEQYAALYRKAAAR